MSQPARPAPGQQTLERGRQLQILRTCRLGDPKKRNDRKPVAKALLRAIDDHVGRNGRWTIHLEQLFEEIEVSRSAGYQWFRWLLDNELIGCDPRPDGRNEIWICWSTLWGLTPEGAASQSASPPHGPAVQQVDQRSTTWTDQSTTWTSGPPHGLHNKEERPESAQNSAPSPPPPAISEQEAAVARRLVSLGVVCGDRAVERGVKVKSLEEISSIVDHFENQLTLPDGRRAFSEPDPLKYLFWRIAEAASMAPSEGWPEATPEFRRARYELAEQQKMEREREAFRASRQARQEVR